MTDKYYQLLDYNSMTVNGHSRITVTDIVSKWTVIDYSSSVNIILGD